MNARSARLARCTLLLIACMAGLASCGEIMGRLSRAYTGPQPSTDPLLDEVVIVRRLSPSVGRTEILAERTRFAAAGDLHNVNRVVRISTDAASEAEVNALALQLGDTLVVSTRFITISETGGSHGVPNWPGHNAMDYPISDHRFTSARRP